ncbi:MAG TPA: hypothetical protein VFF69_03265 [Phycisphaerales bacterium]|nr:hypothetical protein [Phycisphaerales bacterium]
MQTLTRTASLTLAALALTLGACETTRQSAGADACCGGDGACCAEGEAATLSAANESCPISGRSVSPEVETVAFDGKQVGFCCNGCAGKFAAMSEADKAAAMTH